jgi:hypothetical protein
MPIIPCPSCARNVSNAASSCVHCGAALTRRQITEYPAPPQSWAPNVPAAALPHPYAQPAEVPVAEAGEFHPLAIHKLIVMSVCTLGLYELFWFYRNWKRVQERTGQSMMPFWRAFFSPLWAYSLFEEVDDEARRRQIQSGWSSVLLAIAFFLLTATWRLPDPWGLVSLFSWVPLVPVQATINQMALRRGVRPNAYFGGWHIVLVLLGAVVALLAVIGSFVPA